MKSLLENREHLLYFLVVLSFLICRIPIVGKYIRIVNTLIHEMGHALMALFTQGEVQKIELFSDTSGATYTKSSSWAARFLVSIIGYPFSSAISFLLFYLIQQGQVNAVFYFFGVLSLIGIIFWIRNIYGVFWILTFLGSIVAVYYQHNELLTYAFVVTISSIVLTDALYSALQVLYLSVISSNTGSDAKNLAQTTGIPAFLWGLLFAGQAIWFVYLSVRLFVS